MQIPFEVKARPDTGLWNAKIGIWLFLASEVMLFGGLFSGYLFLRLGSHGEADYFWPHGELNVWFGFVNTLILILSSVFVVIAWLQLKLREYKKFQIWMGLVVACAAIFLINKGFEYHSKFIHYGIKLSDNSIVNGHGLDNTIRYEGITEVGVQVNRFNGEFLASVEGDAPPKFQEVIGRTPEGDPILGDEVFELSTRKVKAIAERIDDVAREKLKSSDGGRWYPAMGVRQLTFIATSPFAIELAHSKLRTSSPGSARFQDQTELKGTISAATPGLKLAELDRIDLRAADVENVEDSLVWGFLTHGGQDAQKHFLEHRDHILHEAEEAGKAPSFAALRDQHVAHDADHHTSITVPWEHVRLYSNFTPKWNTYYAVYFTLTGLHGLHVFLGAVVLFYFGFFSKKLYDKDPEHLANRVEVGGLFWHFVDLVWIFLFPILYLM